LTIASASSLKVGRKKSVGPEQPRPVLRIKASAPRHGSDVAAPTASQTRHPAAVGLEPMREESRQKRAGIIRIAVKQAGIACGDIGAQVAAPKLLRPEGGRDHEEAVLQARARIIGIQAEQIIDVESRLSAVVGQQDRKEPPELNAADSGSHVMPVSFDTVADDLEGEAASLAGPDALQLSGPISRLSQSTRTIAISRDDGGANRGASPPGRDRRPAAASKHNPARRDPSARSATSALVGLLGIIPFPSATHDEMGKTTWAQKSQKGWRRKGGNGIL